MDSPFPKILLTNTSTMSLHERFTSLVASKQADVTDIRGAVPQLQAASLKNQRLVQQMANRPSVLAALKSKPSLGLGNIKARLGRSSMRGLLYGKPGYSSRPRGRGTPLGSALSQRLDQSVLMQPQYGVYVRREGVVQNRGGRRSVRGKGRAQTSEVHGEFVGHGWPGGRCRADSCPVPTREELDAQLDDYMSMTKSYLDAQLDEYMAEVDSGSDIMQLSTDTLHLKPTS